MSDIKMTLKNVIENRKNNLESENLDEFTKDVLIEKYREYIKQGKTLEDALMEGNFEVIDGYILSLEQDDGNCYKLFEGVYLKVDDRIYYLEEVKKKSNGDVYIDQTIIFELFEAANVNDPIENRDYNYLKVKTLKRGDLKEIDILDEDIELLYSSRILSKIYSNIQLKKQLKSALTNAITYDDRFGTIGWGLVKTENKIIELDVLRPKKVYFTSIFDYVIDSLKRATVSNVFKEYCIEELLKLDKPHNVLCILSYLLSLLIHVITPTVCPNIYIFGASGRGKSFMAKLVSFNKVDYSTSTIHQYLQATSGFRNGCVFWDERYLWGGDILQDVFKQAATDLRLVKRMSNNILYITNVVNICPSNPTPKFIVKSSSELEAILRRGWFLRVYPDDTIEGINKDFLELNKFKLLKMFIEELKKMEGNTFITFEYLDKFQLLEYLFEILVNIVPYDDKTFKNLMNRLKESEKEIFVDMELLDEIVGFITRESINLAAKMRIDDYYAPAVQKANMETNGFCFYENKVYITLRGWQKIGIQDFGQLKDIVEYLEKNNIECNYTRKTLFGKTYRVVEIPVEGELSSSTISTTEVIVEYIKAHGGKVKEWELHEKFSDEAIERALKLGEINKIGDEYFI